MGERERFEAWCKETGRNARRDEDGEYKYLQTRCDWPVWLACAQSESTGLVEELEELSNDWCTSGEDDLESCAIDLSALIAKHKGSK